ncbi:MAG: hypothetical protein RI908_1205, partial [Actinomycetota bacterium]
RGKLLMTGTPAAFFTRGAVVESVDSPVCDEPPHAAKPIAATSRKPHFFDDFPVDVDVFTQPE